MIGSGKGTAAAVGWIGFVLLGAFLTAGGQLNRENQEYALLRTRMVRSQIEARGIKNSLVLEAMRRVERHLFVPVSERQWAYEDNALPIGLGQTISQPYIVGLMTELLQPDSKTRVLEIGTGSGYQAAVLAEICREVYTVEIVPELGKRAAALLTKLGYRNIHCRIGDGYLGWEEEAPFDAVIVTCAPDHIPQPLQDQLAEGGRMVIPVGGSYAQELVFLIKKKGVLERRNIIPVRFVPLVRRD